jgi:hypothetical protein
MKYLKKFSPFLFASLIAVAVPPLIEAQTPPTVAPQAESLLRQASKYLQQQKSYSFQAEITFDDVMPPDFKLQYHSTAQVMVRRPQEFRVDYVGDRRSMNFYFNGKQLTIFDPTANVYGSLSLPQNIDAALNEIDTNYSFVVPLADFIHSDPYQALAGKIKTGYYLGKSTIGGISAHHLAFSQENIDWQIWIEDGKRPLPRKLVITYKNLPGSPQYSAIFSGWEFKPLEESVFRFTPPANANSIEFLPKLKPEKK